jgi:Holliday junction DNA helicase RuvB
LAADTLSDEIEPYLLREQMIVRTPRGRMATPKAYLHVGKAWTKDKIDPDQGLLFE